LHNITGRVLGQAAEGTSTGKALDLLPLMNAFRPGISCRHADNDPFSDQGNQPNQCLAIPLRAGWGMAQELLVIIVKSTARLLFATPVNYHSLAQLESVQKKNKSNEAHTAPR